MFSDKKNSIFDSVTLNNFFLKKIDRMPFNSITHVIFDLDGTLVDTETIYESCCANIIRSFGKEYLPEVRFKVMGTSEQRTCAIIVDELALPISAEDFRSQMNAAAYNECAKARLMNGAARLITHLIENNIPISIATGSSTEMAELKMSGHRHLFDSFHHKVCGPSDAEVLEQKPAPDIFFVAARRFDEKPEPSKCLVFEDSINGVRAAVSAGMQVVMIPDKRISAEHRKDATLVLNSLDEFDPQLFGLPKYST